MSETQTAWKLTAIEQRQIYDKSKKYCDDKARELGEVARPSLAEVFGNAITDAVVQKAVDAVEALELQMPIPMWLPDEQTPAYFEAVRASFETVRRALKQEVVK